jgi:hypothetical protein
MCRSHCTPAAGLEPHVRFPPERATDPCDNLEMNDSTFVLRPISPSDADALRLRGGPLFVVDEHPGYPRRRLDLSWKAALGLPVEHRGISHVCLVEFRARWQLPSPRSWQTRPDGVTNGFDDPCLVDTTAWCSRKVRSLLRAARRRTQATHEGAGSAQNQLHPQVCSVCGLDERAGATYRPGSERCPIHPRWVCWKWSLYFRP